MQIYLLGTILCESENQSCRLMANWSMLLAPTRTEVTLQVSISAYEVRDGGKGFPSDGLLGGKAVDFDVVNEINLFIGGRQSGFNSLKNSGFGFGEMHLMGQEEAVEMIVQMIGRIDKIEMQVVAIREQVHLMTCRAELVHKSKSFSRQIRQHRHPGIDHILRRGTGMAELEHLRYEMIRRDKASLKVRHQLFGGYTDRFNAFSIGIHTKDKAHILLTHQCLEGFHAPRDIEVNEHSSQIKDDNLFIQHAFCRTPDAGHQTWDRRISGRRTFRRTCHRISDLRVFCRNRVSGRRVHRI